MLKNADEIMNEQFRRRSFRYKMFFLGLLFEKYLFLLNRTPDAKKRAILLRDYYFMMRYIDDIVDKDIIIEHSHRPQDIVHYLEEKLYFIQNELASNPNPQDEVEVMIVNCQRQAEELGFSMQKETDYIVRSLLFDAKRFSFLEKEREFMLVEAEVLEKHFYDLDIIGTISGCLKIYNEDVNLVPDIMPLGIASRKYYNLRDFVEDIQAGLINISTEDIALFGITDDHLRIINSFPKEYAKICENKGYNAKELLKAFPSQIIYYLEEEAKRCAEHLNVFCAYRQELDDLHGSTKLTLDKGFSRPVINYLNLTRKNR